MPGAKTLASKEALVALLKAHAAAGRAYGAIGAATAQVLEPHGLLEGKNASMADPSDCGSRVVVDGNLVTGSGPGTAMEFALAVVEKLLGTEAAREVAEALLFVGMALSCVVPPDHDF
jgi:4-methyl-5(b-hydroxyethyl)-thiazole monophosphate biosynthesis